MHIVVATGLNFGDGEYKNMGDVAMLQAAVLRLSNTWPGARIEVLTDSARDLERFCPTASALARPVFTSWQSQHFFVGRLEQFLPPRVARRLEFWKKAIAFRWPRFMTALTSLRIECKDVRGVRANLAAFDHSIRNCDLLVVCGAGGFADSCREWNLYILTVMEAALKHRKRVAMLGQGMGPLNDPVVLSIARRILPKVSIIGLRGTKGDRELLRTIGVAPSKMVTTGDEALELADPIHTAQNRTAIGINVRVAFYSDVNAGFIKDLGALLQNIAACHDAVLAPLPIAFHACANDRETIRHLFEGFDGQVDDGTVLDTPQLLIEQASKCRVVVSGAYHAAVFALGQGVPVVCLCNSPYYDAKFRGLEELFGRGCAIVNFSDPNFTETLRTAIENALSFSDQVRNELLDATAMQIEMGRAAYGKIQSLLGTRIATSADTVSSQADRVF